jgi:Glycosyl hydrolases family 6
MFGGRAVLVVLVAAVAAVATSSTSTAAQAPGNPLAGARLYVDHHSPAWRQWRAYRRRRGAVPVFTVMRAQANDCGPWYTAGGPAEDARTRAWYRRLARTIRRARVVILFEPDSLGTIDCQARSRRDDRIRLLRYG